MEEQKKVRGRKAGTLFPQGYAKNKKQEVKPIDTENKEAIKTDSQ